MIVKAVRIKPAPLSAMLANGGVVCAWSFSFSDTRPPPNGSPLRREVQRILSSYIGRKIMTEREVSELEGLIARVVINRWVRVRLDSDTGTGGWGVRVVVEIE